MVKLIALSPHSTLSPHIPTIQHTQHVSTFGLCHLKLYSKSDFKLQLKCSYTFIGSQGRAVMALHYFILYTSLLILKYNLNWNTLKGKGGGLEVGLLPWNTDLLPSGGPEVNPGVKLPIPAGQGVVNILQPKQLLGRGGQTLWCNALESCLHLQVHPLTLAAGLAMKNRWKYDSSRIPKIQECEVPMEVCSMVKSRLFWKNNSLL